MRALLALALALTGCGCKRDEPALPAPRALPAAPVAAGPVATAAAFDLVANDSGAFLALAPPPGKGGGIVLRALDKLGVARGGARQLLAGQAAGEVIELVMAAADTRIGLAWNEQGPDGLRTRALLLPPGEPPPEPELLATPPRLSTGRGHLAIAPAAGDRARVLFLTTETECLDASKTPCFGFAFRELGVQAESAPRSWLSVPQPCSEGAVALAARPGRFFYSVCSAAGEAWATTAYSISIEPQYARADPVLPGCIPIGFTAVDAETVLLGADCKGLRRVARLTLGSVPSAEFPLVDAALVCDGGQLKLTALGWELALDRPLDRLEGLLPEAIAPTGARAAFTGRALLVAQRMSGELVMRRHTCEAGQLAIATSKGK